MKKQMKKNSKSPNRSSLELGDQVRYTLDTHDGPVERAGKILLMDGPWCVVQHNEEHWVWVSLRCS